MINFELRQYDARIGRWYNPDPYGQHHSPYLAMGNNPVSMVDPDGGWSGSYGGDDAFRDYNFSIGNDNFNNRDADAGINAQEAYQQGWNNYLDDRAENYFSAAGVWGDFKSGYVENTLGTSTFETVFVVDANKKKDRPKVRSEYSGNNALTIRGPVNYTTGSGGYHVSVSPNSIFFKKEDGSVDDFFDPSNSRLYRWNPDYNAYYNYVDNEVYGGIGVNIANAYMQTTTGANFGQSDHPDSDIGIGIGKVQNVINAVATVGNGVNLLRAGLFYAPKIGINIFGLKGGYGIFGTKGLKFGKFKLDAMYSSPSQGLGTGTFLSIKSTVKGGNMLRWDYGIMHSRKPCKNTLVFALKQHVMKSPKIKSKG